MSIIINKQESRGDSLVALEQLRGNRPLLMTPLTNKIANNPQVFNSSQAHLTNKIENNTIDRNMVIEHFNIVLQQRNDLKVFKEQIVNSIVLAFYIRDIHYGRGERDLFYWLLIELIYIFPTTMLDIEYFIPLIIKYGSFLDIPRIAEIVYLDKLSNTKHNKLLDKIYFTLVEFYGETLKKDILKKPIKRTLAGKWAPRINSHYDKTCKFGKAIAKYIYPIKYNKYTPKNELDKMLRNSYKQYRLLISKLSIDKCIEYSMCNKEWKWIGDNLHQVTKKAKIKYKMAFKDEIIYGKYRGNRRNPENKDRTYLKQQFENYNHIYSSNHQEDLEIYHIVEKYLNGESEDQVLENNWNMYIKQILEPKQWIDNLNTILNHLDNDLIPIKNDITKDAIQFLNNKLDSIENKDNLELLIQYYETQTSIQSIKKQLLDIIDIWYHQISIFDNYISCYDINNTNHNEVYITLCLLISELQQEDCPYKNRFIISTNPPSWYEINGDSLWEKVNNIKNLQLEDEIINISNILKPIVLDIENNEIKLEYLPKKIWIFSNVSIKNQSQISWNTIYNNLKLEQKQFDYQPYPEIILWNTKNDNLSYQEYLNIKIYGGFSKLMFHSICQYICNTHLFITPTTNKWEKLKNKLDNERYHSIRIALNKSNEGILKEYIFEENIQIDKPNKINNSSDDDWITDISIK